MREVVLDRGDRHVEHRSPASRAKVTGSLTSFGRGRDVVGRRGHGEQGAVAVEDRAAHRAGTSTVVTCSRLAALLSRPALSVASCSARTAAIARSRQKTPSSQPILR